MKGKVEILVKAFMQLLLWGFVKISGMMVRGIMLI
jgi:hypothetical protein